MSNTFQYRTVDNIWPEMEVNLNQYCGGNNNTNNTIVPTAPWPNTVLSHTRPIKPLRLRSCTRKKSKRCFRKVNASLHGPGKPDKAVRQN